MQDTLAFPELLRLIDERSTVFRAVVAAAPSLDAQVPTCPDWTLFDLAQHLGQGRLRWSRIVTAGPDAAPPPKSDDPAAPRERAALLDWSAAATAALLDALRTTGPDRGCWTWWARSQSPQTTGAVARHQLYEVAVHTHDAQLTVGDPQPLPDEMAIDAVDEFMVTCSATTSAWPHQPAVVDFHATEGRSWRLSLGADGARVGDVSAAGADAAIRGTASEVALVLYDRLPIDSLPVDGDRGLFDLLWAWNPDA